MFVTTFFFPTLLPTLLKTNASFLSKFIFFSACATKLEQSLIVCVC